jgi:hypothetical protein
MRSDAAAVAFKRGLRGALTLRCMLFKGLLLAIALLNLLPGAVALVPRMSAELYGLPLDSQALAVVVRHRAVLLACVGLALGLAAFRDGWWAPALSLALASKLSFLVLCLCAPAPLGPLLRVAAADVIALLGLAWAAWLRP